MLTSTDVQKVYETILSMPGMNDPVKIELRITRRNILLLERVIARGLNGKGGEEPPTLLEGLSPEAEGELQALAIDCLQKAGLTVLSEKLKALSE